MAKGSEEQKIVMERVYNVPLRREFLKVPKWRRTEKAVKALREFLIKNMKGEDVKVSKHINLEIWKHGIKNPPHHIKVNVTKDDKGIIRAELFGIAKGEAKKKHKTDGEKADKAGNGKADDKKGG